MASEYYNTNVTYSDINIPRKQLFHILCNKDKIRDRFPELYLKEKNEPIDDNFFKSNEILFVAEITKKISSIYISGTLKPMYDKTLPSIKFEWILESLPIKSWTRLTMHIKAPSIKSLNQRWWAITPLGGLSFIKLLEESMANTIPEAFADSIVNSPVSVTAITTETVKSTSSETISQVVSGTVGAPITSTITKTSTKTGISSGTSASTKVLVGIITALTIGGGIFGAVYASSSNALLEMEELITLANEQYEYKQYKSSFDTFSKADTIFLNTGFSPDHLEYAEYLHMQSLVGMGNSLQSQSNFGQIESFSEQAEEYYLYAITLYEGKHDTENAWIGRGINAIYETPEKTIEICSMFRSINSHMCQGEAYSYMYVTGKVPLEKAEEQFEMALDMAGSENQKLKVQDDIDEIKSGVWIVAAQKNANIQKDIDEIKLEVKNNIDKIHDYYKLPTK